MGRMCQMSGIACKRRFLRSWIPLHRMDHEDTGRRGPNLAATYPNTSAAVCALQASSQGRRPEVRPESGIISSVADPGMPDGAAARRW